MGTYQFEVCLTVSELMDIEADSYDEAVDLAAAEAEGGYTCLTPEGYSIPWDYVETNCIAEPDEDENV